MFRHWPTDQEPHYQLLWPIIEFHTAQTEEQICRQFFNFST